MPTLVVWSRTAHTIHPRAAAETVARSLARSLRCRTWITSSGLDVAAFDPDGPAPCREQLRTKEPKARPVPGQAEGPSELFLG